MANGRWIVRALFFWQGLIFLLFVVDADLLKEKDNY